MRTRPSDAMRVSSTRPACRSRRRCRLTAGLLTANRPATSPNDRGPSSQQIHDRSAGGVSQTGEGAVHPSSLARHVRYVVNHTVNYMQATSFVNPTHT